jgi:hypothetical protein
VPLQNGQWSFVWEMTLHTKFISKTMLFRHQLGHFFPLFFYVKQISMLTKVIFKLVYAKVGSTEQKQIAVILFQHKYGSSYGQL